jgi:hypothetical protein
MNKIVIIFSLYSSSRNFILHLISRLEFILATGESEQI